MEAKLKAGHVEQLKAGDHRLSFYWEVWRSDIEILEGMHPRPRFVVEVSHVTGGHILYKRGFDIYVGALNHFESLKREHAVGLALDALGIIRRDVNEP